MNAIHVLDSGPTYGSAFGITRRQRTRDFLQLTKPRMNALVVLAILAISGPSRSRPTCSFTLRPNAAHPSASGRCLTSWPSPFFIATITRAGFCMLPVTDQSLDARTRQNVLYSLALIPTTLVPVLLGISGSTYCWAAVILGITFCAIGLVLNRSRSLSDATSLFVASIAYLACLLIFMACDKYT